MIVGRLAIVAVFLLAGTPAPAGSLTTQATHSGEKLTQAFLCIHRHEGAWNDPNAPYYGGLQMDREFMRTYGREFYAAWGTADHWPPSVQLAVAMRAYFMGRGFGPWPATARMCGLLP